MLQLVGFHPISVCETGWAARRRLEAVGGRLEPGRSSGADCGRQRRFRPSEAVCGRLGLSGAVCGLLCLFGTVWSRLWPFGLIWERL